MSRTVVLAVVAVAVIIAVTIIFTVVVAAAASAAATPHGAAHRGSHEECRWTENTIRSFRQCAGAADVLEVDLRTSRDNIPVVFHDARLDRTTVASGRVDARTFKQLRRIPTADGVGRIPSLKMLANHIGETGQAVIVDVKAYPTSKGWRRIVNQLGPHRDRVIFASAKHEKFIKKAKGLGFHAAHFSWSDRGEPAPSVAEVRRWGDHVWRASMSDAQARRYRNAGLTIIQSGNSGAAWERADRQGAWAVNTDRINSYNAWASQ